MSVRVAIIGAGPYGLSLAAHLAARGVEHRILGRTMTNWERHMPNGMFLKSEGFASSIDEPSGRWTLRSFCDQAGLPYADVGWPVPIETFRSYGRWFQRSLVPHVEEDEVIAVTRAGDDFSLELASGGRGTARQVVVATGISTFTYVPPELRSLPPDRLSHTYEHADLGEFRGRHVAVVGAGQSALEAAALLRENGARPELIVRSSALSWNPNPEIPGYGGSPAWRLRPTPLGGGSELWGYWHFLRAFPFLPEELRARFVQRTLGPAGAWWLRARVAEKIPVSLAHEVVDAQKTGSGVDINLAAAGEPRQIRADHVIAGTGYRIDLDRLGFLSQELRGRIRRACSVPGAPLLSTNSESSVHGLYFVGLAAAPRFGPAMRFVCGSSFAVPRLARHLAGR
jgi:cation diffusion facilitator CzcD-associated flavoprotein CzcO